MIRLGTRGWQLHRGPACPDCEPVPGLRDAFWAREWLRAFKSDGAALATIRSLAAEANLCGPMPKFTTDQAIEWLAQLLRDGRWHVHAPVFTDKGGGSASNSAADANQEEPLEVVKAASSSGSSAPKPPKPPADEEGALPRNADEAAIVESLKLASKLGIPFCEECTRAALKSAQGVA